jgi:hypothetical protein
LVLHLHNEQELKQFGNKVTRISGPRKTGLNEETYTRLNLLKAKGKDIPVTGHGGP